MVPKIPYKTKEDTLDSKIWRLRLWKRLSEEIAKVVKIQKQQSVTIYLAFFLKRFKTSLIAYIIHEVFLNFIPWREKFSFSNSFLPFPEPEKYGDHQTSKNYVHEELEILIDGHVPFSKGFLTSSKKNGVKEIKSRVLFLIIFLFFCDISERTIVLDQFLSFLFYQWGIETAKTVSHFYEGFQF